MPGLLPLHQDIMLNQAMLSFLGKTHLRVRKVNPYEPVREKTNNLSSDQV